MAPASAVGTADWLSFALSFLLVLTLLCALYFFLRRMNSKRLMEGGEPELEIVDSLAVGTRQRVVLLRVKDREVLLGMTVQNITPLASWSAEEVARLEAVRRSKAPAATGQAKGLQGMLALLAAKNRQGPK